MSFKLFKNARVYSPEDQGQQDVLVFGDTIIQIAKALDLASDALGLKCEIIDLEGCILAPGIIDQHAHITGGGGEGSFRTRVPEAMLGDFIRSGVSTVVGLLGTDSTTRGVENLLAKTKALREEGLNAYCLTGSYDYPSVTLTDSVSKDISFIQEILGLKLAISDHRSPVIRADELAKLAARVRNAGMFSGKNAYLKLHMGGGKDRLKLVREVLEMSDLPISLFRPTHVGRDAQLFEEALDFAQEGGIIDITAGATSNIMSMSELFRKILKRSINLSRVTISSDAFGSWSSYDEEGRLKEIGVLPCDTVHATVVELVKNKVLSLSDALSLCSSNVSSALGLTRRGHIEVGYYADLLILDKDLAIDGLLLGGQWAMREKEQLLFGSYEKR